METAGESPRVEVRRSRRRTRTVSARREQDAIVVLIPARLSAAEEREWVDKMVQRVIRAERRAERRARSGDIDLASRAARLSDRYLDGLAQPLSVRWVDNQHTRWGSCTPADRSIRISERVRGMPDYVVDYVLLHELTHLLVHGHGADFWAWLGRYPQTERARGFLDGVSSTAHLDITDNGDEESAPPPSI